MATPASPLASGTPQSQSPRTKVLPQCCVSWPGSKRTGLLRNFVAGSLSVADKQTLLFTPTDDVEALEIVLTRVSLVYVFRPSKEAPFVVAEIFTANGSERFEVCFRAEKDVLMSVEMLRDHLAGLAAVATDRPVIEFIGEDEREGSGIFSRLGLKGSPRRKGGGISPRKDDTRSSIKMETSPQSGNSASASPAVSPRENKPPSQAQVGSGWLWKEFPSHWRRKYFLLLAGQLIYYENDDAVQTGQLGSGFLDLAFMTKTQTHGMRKEQAGNGTTVELWTFSLEMSNNRSWVLGAESPESCISWLQKLTSVAGSQSRMRAVTFAPPTRPRQMTVVATGLGPGARESLMLQNDAIDDAYEAIRGQSSEQLQKLLHEGISSTISNQSDAAVDEEFNYLERLAEELGCYEPGLESRIIGRTGTASKVKTTIQAVLDMDDDVFYDDADDDSEARARSGTSSRVEEELRALEEAIFAGESDSISHLVHQAIEDHVAEKGGGDAERMECAARLRSRIATIAERKATRSLAVRASQIFSADEDLPPLPDVSPSIHDHKAYLAYIRLRKAWDRRKQADKGFAAKQWTRSREHSIDETAAGSRTSIPSLGNKRQSSRSSALSTSSSELSRRAPRKNSSGKERSSSLTKGTAGRPRTGTSSSQSGRSPTANRSVQNSNGTSPEKRSPSAAVPLPARAAELKRDESPPTVGSFESEDVEEEESGDEQ